MAGARNANDDDDVEDGGIELVGNPLRCRVEDDAVETTAKEEPRMSRLPLVTLCFAMFANSVALTNPFPYAGFMVMRFGITSDPERTGYYAGYIMSSFMVGRLMSSFYCGVLADRIGRKFVIRMGLVSCVVLQLAFGVAPTFNVACLFRFLMGLFNGLTAVAKALLPELVPKGQQQSAMAYVTSMWTLGMIAGPAAGGLLVVDSFRFPYLLPNAFGSLLALIALILVELYIPGKKQGYAALKTHDGDDEVVKKEEEAKGVCCGIERNSVLPVGIYGLYSFLTIAYDECLPLWCLAPPSVGGLGMEARLIGSYMAIVGALNAGYQFLIFPLFSDRVGPTALYTAAATLAALLTALTPLLRLLFASSRWLGMAGLVCHSALQKSAVSTAYTAMFCVINNSTSTDRRGRVNGFAMMIGSAFKAGGPPLGAVALAWSFTNGLPDPFDFHFVFLAAAILFLATAFIARKGLPAAEYDEPPPDGHKRKQHASDHNLPIIDPDSPKDPRSSSSGC